MGDYAVTFGSAGTAFAAGDVIAESLREKEDLYNGAYGALSAGLVLGIRSGKRGRRERSGKGKGRPGKGRPGKGKARPAEESSESEETEDEVFDVVDFVRGDVEERTCVYRQLGWVCEESGQVNLDAMRSDISSAIITSEAVKFPMLCSLTERVQEDLDIAFPGADIDLDLVIHRLSEEDRQELGRLATPLGFFNCAMDAFHAGCKRTVEDMLLAAHPGGGQQPAGR